MVFDGFGIHAKLVGVVPSRPADRQVTIDCRGPAAGAVRRVQPPPLRLRPRSGGDADPLHASTRSKRDFIPWNDTLPPQRSGPTSASTRGRTARPARARSGPSTRAWWPARRIRWRANSRASPEARPRRRRPVPRRPQLQDAAGVHRETCAASATARRRDRRSRRRTLGRAEQATPSCPASSSQIGTTNVAAGPGGHPFHAVGKMYLAGPFKGAPLEPRGGHAGARRPLRLRRRRRPGRPPRRSAHGPGLRGLGHGAVDHRRRPDPDALDPGQHRQARTSRSTRPTARRSGRLPGDRRPGHGHRLLAPTSRRSTARALPFKPKMTMRQIGGRKGTTARARTRSCNST